MALKFSTTVRNAMADSITSTVGGSAVLRIYDGTRPTNVATAVTTQTILAELTCNATFAPAASGGVLTLNGISGDASNNNSGTASWFRLFASNGTTALIDGDVGTSGTDMIISSTTIVASGTTNVTAATITIGGA